MGKLGNKLRGLMPGAAKNQRSQHELQQNVPSPFADALREINIAIDDLAVQYADAASRLSQAAHEEDMLSRTVAEMQDAAAAALKSGHEDIARRAFGQQIDAEQKYAAARAAEKQAQHEMDGLTITMREAKAQKATITAAWNDAKTAQASDASGTASPAQADIAMARADTAFAAAMAQDMPPVGDMQNSDAMIAPDNIAAAAPSIDDRSMMIENRITMLRANQEMG